MAVSPSSSSSSLELTISIPGFSPCSSRPSPGDHHHHLGVTRELDINQKPGEEDEWRKSATMEMEMEDDGEESSHGNNKGSSEGPPRKKLRLTKEQSHLLEESFRLNHTLNPKQKQELAVQLKLRPRQVEVWFQNRRARSKLKQTEIECEYLKRWFGSLTEQNRRLQKEVEELRGLKVSPPTLISHHTSHPLPASALTMCPGCERVTTASTATTTSVAVTVDKGRPNAIPASEGGSPRSKSRRPSSSLAC